MRWVRKKIGVWIGRKSWYKGISGKVDRVRKIGGHDGQNRRQKKRVACREDLWSIEVNKISWRYGQR